MELHDKVFLIFITIWLSITAIATFFDWVLLLDHKFKAFSVFNNFNIIFKPKSNKSNVDEKSNLDNLWSLFKIFFAFGSIVNHFNMVFHIQSVYHGPNSIYNNPIKMHLFHYFGNF